MLTKEHLKFRVRTGAIKPSFLAAADEVALALARDMAALTKDAAGMRLGDLEESLSALGSDDVAAAFRKLLLDSCAPAEDSGEVEALRWACLEKAQALRTAGPRLAAAEFQAQLAAELGSSYGELKERLYSDLPACRRIATVKDTTAEALVARYNCAQVQGLLIRARTVTVTLIDAPLPERRELFRQLKFHRLMGEVLDEKGKLQVTLSGPLGIFDQAATYGLRLANFFPHVLHLSRWRLEAEVHIKNKTLALKLDEKSGLVSHYRHHRPFIPDELLAFLKTFNERETGWHAEAGAEFVHIGRESYCFPDLTITSRKGRVVHVELFHRWHAGQLLSRLQAVEINKISGLLLGVGKNLAKTPDVAARLQESSWFAKNGFIFSEFPTPRTLASLLGPA